MKCDRCFQTGAFKLSDDKSILYCEICGNIVKEILKEKPMENKVNCNQCQRKESKKCSYPNLNYCNEFEPMKNKVIFESEEECADFLCDVYNHSKGYCLRSLVPMAKQKGYIRKSAVEEAEDKWHNSSMQYHSSDYYKDEANPVVKDLIYDAELYIQELKAENERLKK